MSNIDPQAMQQIVQFLATYGAPAGIAAAQTIGTEATQALGNGATQAIKGLWAKIRDKSKQEGSIGEATVTAFESAPDEPEHQQFLTIVLNKLCTQDSSFAHDVAQLFEEIQHDPTAGQFIQHISGNAQVGVAGVNYGHVNIHQTAQEKEVLWQDKLIAVMKHFELVWKVTYAKDSMKAIEPSLSVLREKIIAASDELIYILSQNYKAIPKELGSNISSIAAQLETLGHWQFLTDGLKSFNKFNEFGDAIEREVANLIEQIRSTQ